MKKINKLASGPFDTEVKQHRARIVLGNETPWKLLVPKPWKSSRWMANSIKAFWESPDCVLDSLLVTTAKWLPRVLEMGLIVWAMKMGSILERRCGFKANKIWVRRLKARHQLGLFRAETLLKSTLMYRLTVHLIYTWDISHELNKLKIH